MVNDESPVKEYYPVDFETDLNGKLQEWEAVVLIPFIDEVGLILSFVEYVFKVFDLAMCLNVKTIVKWIWQKNYDFIELYVYYCDSMKTYINIFCFLTFKTTDRFVVHII